MKSIYKTNDGILYEESAYSDGAWIHLISPTPGELYEIAQEYDIDPDDLKAALDTEESARVQLEDGYTLILVDIPTEEVRNQRKTYTTIPLGIILTGETIITICSADTPILHPFIKMQVKGFSTKKRMRFIYQIFLRATLLYHAYLRAIDRNRALIEVRIDDNNTQDTDLVDLHEQESTLVYFATSLSANKIVLERMSRYERIKQYPDDTELLEDVVIENRQAIEMCNTYRDIIHGTRDLLSTVINNRMNNIMKYLTSITLVMAIPTIISGLYGMNVSGNWMPLSDTPHGFGIICAGTLIICVLALLILKKRKML